MPSASFPLRVCLSRGGSAPARMLCVPGVCRARQCHGEPCASRPAPAHQEEGLSSLASTFPAELSPCGGEGLTVADLVFHALPDALLCQIHCGSLLGQLSPDCPATRAVFYLVVRAFEHLCFFHFLE